MSEHINITHIKTKLREIHKINVIEKKELPNELYDEFFEIMAMTKEYKIYEIKDEIISLLEAHDDFIRDEVVATLGFSTRLRLTEFKDKAYDIFLNDTSEMVQRTALAAWSDYYVLSKNKNALLILYKILADEDFNINIRTISYIGIFKTIALNHPDLDIRRDPNKLMNSKTAEEFNSNVNWEAVHKIMRQYAPEALEK